MRRPPIRLEGAVATFPLATGRTANTPNRIRAEWTTFGARAQFRVDPTEGGIDDWAVGYVQRVLVIDRFDCFKRLSGPATEPTSRPLDSEPVLVLRESLPSSGLFPLDGAIWRDVRWARPPIVGATFVISASMSDSPAVRRPGFIHRDGVDTCIDSSYVHAQFFVTVGARHIDSNRLYPMWHIRWDLRARYRHVRHFHADFESQRDETCFHRAVVSSRPSAHDMGADGYVRGPGVGEAPANEAQTASETWPTACPEP